MVAPCHFCTLILRSWHFVNAKMTGEAAILFLWPILILLTFYYLQIIRGSQPYKTVEKRQLLMMNLRYLPVIRTCVHLVKSGTRGGTLSGGPIVKTTINFPSPPFLLLPRRHVYSALHHSSDFKSLLTLFQVNWEIDGALNVTFARRSFSFWKRLNDSTSEHKPLQSPSSGSLSWFLIYKKLLFFSFKTEKCRIQG